MSSASKDDTTAMLRQDAMTAVAEDGISGTDPVGLPSLAGALADTAAVFGQLGPLHREGRARAACPRAAVPAQHPDQRRRTD